MPLKLKTSSGGSVTLTGTSSQTTDTTFTLPIGDDTAAALGVDQSWTGSQRATLVTDNDGSFDMNAGQNFKCTPTALVDLTFTNVADGQSGFIILVNGSSYSHTKNSLVKATSSFLSDIGAQGTFVISYICDGTNVFVTNSKALS